MKDKLSDRLNNFLNRTLLVFYSHRLWKAAIFPLLLLALIRLASYYFSIDFSVVLAGYAAAVLWLIYQLAEKIRQLPLDKKRLASRFVDHSADWEVLRVGLDSAYPLHRYYREKLEEELEEFLGDKFPREVLTRREIGELFTALLLLILILPLGFLPAVQPPGGPPPYRDWELEVEPETVPVGDTATVIFRGSSVPAPELVIRETDSSHERAVGFEQEGDSYIWNSYPLEKSKRLFLRGGGNRLEKGEINVVPPPRIGSVEKRIYPPSYTNLTPREPSGRNLEVYPGSSISLRVQTSRPMNRLRVTSARGEIVEKKTSTSTLEFNQYLLNPGDFYVSGTDTYGFETDEYSYRVALKEDPPPALTVVEPRPKETVPGEGLLSVQVEYTDSFGLSEAGVVAWRGEEKLESELAFPERQPEGEIYGNVDLQRLDLLPGESFQLQVYARDLDQVQGPKKTEVEPLELRVHSWEEMMARQERSRRQTALGLDEMTRDISELREQMEDLIRSGEAGDWETARQMQQIQENIQQKEEQLRQAQENIEDYSRSSPGLSPESMSRLQEIQSMVEEYGLDALEQSQETLQEQLEEDGFSAEDLQYSSDQLADFEEDIERTHEYLKNIETALEIDRMAQSLDQMVEEQEGLEDLTETERERILEKQADQWEWMEDKLAEMAGETEEDISQKLSELKRAMESSPPQEQAQDLAADFSEQSLADYAERTQEFQEQMGGLTSDQFARQDEKQRALQEDMVDYWTRWYSHLLDWEKTVQDLQVPPRFLAQYGVDLEDLYEAMERLTALRRGWNHLAATTRQLAGLDLGFPREIVQALEDQEEEFEEIYEWMSDRRLGRVRSKLPDLISSQAVFIHKFLAWEQEQPPAGGEGQPSLEELLAGQQQLQQQMAPLFEQETVSPEMARQMARQQEMIRQGLEEFARQSARREEIMGDLEALAEEMEEAEEKMEKREFDAQLESQQDEILDRLEQATKAIEADRADQQQVDADREATVGIDLEAEGEISDFQQIMNRISSQLDDLSASEREAVLRFYRYFHRKEEQPDG